MATSDADVTMSDGSGDGGKGEVIELQRELAKARLQVDSLYGILLDTEKERDKLREKLKKANEETKMLKRELQVIMI